MKKIISTNKTNNLVKKSITQLGGNLKIATNIFKASIKEPTNEEKQLLAHFRIGVLTALKTLNLYAFQLTTMVNLVKQEEKATLKNILTFTENSIKSIWRIKEAKFKGKEFDNFNNGLEKKIDFGFELNEIGLLVLNDDNLRAKVIKRFEEVVYSENKNFLKRLQYKSNLKND